VLSVASDAETPPARSYDRHAFGHAIGDIQSALYASDFERLDSMYDQLLHARTVDGTWMAKVFPEAFETVFVYMPPGKVRKLFETWKVRNPSSHLRPIAEAFAWQERAWNVKGSECYSQVPPEARKAFDVLLDHAASALRESEAQDGSSPLWQVAAMLVAGGQGRSGADLDALLGKWTRQSPGFEPLYAARLVFLMPEWGGDYGKVDRFIRLSAKQTAAIEGRSFYAWLYLEVAQVSRCEDLLDRSEVSWPDLQAAFEDMLVRYPDVWNRNLYATFACRARDEETTRRLLGELGKDAHLGAYTSSISNKSCYRMLQPPAPPVKRA
jgi:hypothetical protein